MPRRYNLFALAASCVVAVAAHASPPPGYAASLAVYRPGGSHLYAYADLGTRTLALDGVFGSAGDVPVVGDFDGNGVGDAAVYRSGTWYIDLDHNFSGETTLSLGGNAGDIPLAGDFDGDGKADLVIFRAGTWFIRSSMTGQVSQRTLGAAGDQPVVADFDNDGVPDPGVFRNGTWLLQTQGTSGSSVVDHFGGLPGDVACAFDWDRDGRADLCLYRDGIWYFQSVGSGALLDSYAFGGAGDVPLAGGALDYAGAIYVKAGAGATQDGTPAHPYSTIGKAFDAAVDGSTIRVAGGSYGENVVLFGPAVNYAPNKFGKNNLKLIGASRRAVHLVPASGDAIVLQGSSGNVLQGFTIGSTSGRGVVLIGGAGSVSPSLPGSGMAISLDTIEETFSYGVLVTGASHADIRHNRIARSKTKSGIGTQGGAPDAVVVDNELTLNGYTLASGSDGNGFEAQSSSTATLSGNRIHDNNRFGVIGVTDSHLAIDANSITANRLNGIIMCGSGANDTSTAQVTNNWIGGNGVDVQNGQGYNGLEFFLTCIGTHTVTGNTFEANSLNGIFIGSAGATIAGNIFSDNKNGITVYAETSSSANTQISVTGNTFDHNLQDGIFVQRAAGSTRSVTATVGGTQAGKANSFIGHGFHGIGCAGSPLQLTCPSGGNTFSANNDDIEFTCPATCVK
jgi:hypothetical protein